PAVKIAGRAPESKGTKCGLAKETSQCPQLERRSVSRASPLSAVSNLTVSLAVSPCTVSDPPPGPSSDTAYPAPASSPSIALRLAVAGQKGGMGTWSTCFRTVTFTVPGTELVEGSTLSVTLSVDPRALLARTHAAKTLANLCMTPPRAPRRDRAWLRSTL